MTEPNSACTIQGCPEPPVIEVTEPEGYYWQLCLKHLWRVDRKDTVALLDGAVAKSHIYEPPPTVAEPIIGDDGFPKGWRVTHPAGVECSFHPEFKQCTCGKMELGVVTDESSTEPTPAQ